MGAVSIYRNYTPGGWPGHFSTSRSMRHTEIEARYRRQSQTLSDAVNNKVNALAGAPQVPPTLESIDREILAVKKLLDEHQNAQDAANEQALAFDGTDPLDSPKEDFRNLMRAGIGRRKPYDLEAAKTFNIRFNVWQASYQAAFDARIQMEWRHFHPQRNRLVSVEHLSCTTLNISRMAVRFMTYTTSQL